MHAQSPAVTVLTPVYNGAAYLAQCVESVLAQSYPFDEYVIADNASTDDSAAIARRYAATDGRVRVVSYEEHLANHLANWNRALELVAPQAAYVKLVHADDWIFDECIARMVECAERNPTVGLVGAYRLDEDRVNLDGLDPSVSVVPGRDVARSFLLGGPLPFVFGSPTSLLVRADKIRSHRPFYNEANLHADTEACLAVLRDSDFGVVHQVLTYTRRHNEAVTSYATRMGTVVPADVDMFQRWGHVFLSEDEFDRKLAVRLAHYLAFLGRHPLRLLRTEFRSYHRDRLRLILGRTSGRQVARGIRLQLWRGVSRSSARPAS